CKNAIKNYQENNYLLDLKQILDKINKDLRKISKFDYIATYRKKNKTYNLQLE
ncbi:11740_t:CDS:1, partial [Gigaspora margarita]